MIVTPFSLENYLTGVCQKIELALRNYLPSKDMAPTILVESLEYSLFAGGKRLRPSLTLAACEACGGDVRKAIPAACAIEMIHTYSLIHDDLPAMDDDDYRRGKPTSHKVFGDANAILAGDALMAEAFSLLSDPNRAMISGETALKVMSEIASASGSVGMVGGQVLDLQGEGVDLSIEELNRIHRYKTGALISASVAVGGIIADASTEALEALSVYASAVGLAFQIADDLLDVLGDSAELGKPAGSDEEKNKATYPALLGIDESKREAQRLVEQAVDALIPFEDRATPLRAIAQHIIERKN